MRIIAYRKQFLSDHSSTNYLFYSPEPLDEEAIEEVNGLSSHVDVGDCTAEITYNGESADLDQKRLLKFLKHFSVCIKESYDWWDMVIVLDKKKVEPLDLLEKYKDCGDEASLSFTKQGDNIILWFQGAHFVYGGFRTMEDIARKLGSKIRDEIHKGKLDCVDVMANYCTGEPSLEGRKLSRTAQSLSKILEFI